MTMPFPRSAEAFLYRFLEDHARIRADHEFQSRFVASFSPLYRLFFQLYGTQARATELFEELLHLLWSKWNSRDERLRVIDRKRVATGAWYSDGSLVGMQLYVDRFGGDLSGVQGELDYFRDLGVNALHLMPLLKTPVDHNDGGYAVSDYRSVQPSLGTMDDVRSLSERMHSRDMVLVLDYVLNHTSDEHPWAQAALEGEMEYQDYYFMYPDRTIPDAYEAALPEVFPETAPGSFTWREEMNRWVMTVFHSYQWDLNYANPRVFLEMVGILLDLANQGVDILRLDAVPYLWKRIGTAGQNLPEAHVLVRLLNACARIAAPGIAFIAEAIVQPREIARYFGEDQWAGRECELAYNASMMVLLWDAIATHKTILLQRALHELPHPPVDTTWLNYVRCHDDIGLGYDEDHVRSQGWDPVSHRQFIVRYFTGEFPGSPARGARFMYNPKNGDARISGTTASLAGIEAALRNADDEQLQRAIKRHLILHAIILSLGGIPVIYAGDELGLCNDYSYSREQHLAGDNRWMHRPWISDRDREARKRSGTVADRIFSRLRELIDIRRRTPALCNTSMPDIIRSGNPHLLVYLRSTLDGSIVLIVANMDESSHTVGNAVLAPAGFHDGTYDIAHGVRYEGEFMLGPFDFTWLIPASALRTGQSA